MKSNMQHFHWLDPGYPGATSRHGAPPICTSRGLSSSYLHIQGLKNSSRHSFGTWPGTLLSINFPQNFPLALIGCLGTPASSLAWGIQLLFGSTTVQTCYALCAKICIFYILCILIQINAFMWLPLAFQVQ